MVYKKQTNQNNKNTRPILEITPIKITISKYSSETKALTLKKRIYFSEKQKNSIHRKRELKITFLIYGKYEKASISLKNEEEVKDVILHLQKALKDFKTMKNKPLINLMKNLEYRPNKLMPEDLMAF